MVWHRVYVVIRLFIRIAEYLIARPKHRKLRRLMEQSKSYSEWFAHAAALDKSQNRDRWLRQMDDRTSERYNWGFIRELVKDLKRARATEDSLLALAVLQQCTRKVRCNMLTTSVLSFTMSRRYVRRLTELISLWPLILLLECWRYHDRRPVFLLQYW
jgi:hypothetical protein